MGLLDGLLGPALTVATQAEGTHQAADLQAKLTQRAQAIQGLLLQRQMALQNAQIQHLGAQTDAETANAAYTRHRNQAPVLGEDGYAQAEGDVAGAQERAKLPGEKDLASYQSNLTEGREGRLLDKRIQAEMNAPTIGSSAAKSFASQNAPLVAGVTKYAQVKDAIAQARAGNPAALKPALLGYASVADPNAQLRQGVMREVMQVDPSVAGRWDLTLDKLSTGTLPPRVLDDMERMVDQLHQTNRAMYDQRRSAAVHRIPVSDTFIPRTEEVFDVPGISGSSGSAGAGGSGAANPFGDLVPKKGPE